MEEQEYYSMTNSDSERDFTSDAMPHELDEMLQHLKKALTDLGLAETDWQKGQESVLMRTRTFLSTAPNNGETESLVHNTSDVSLNELYGRFAARFRKVADSTQFQELPSGYCPPWIVGTWPLYRWGDDIEEYFQTLLRTLAFYENPTDQLSEIIEETETRTEKIHGMFHDMKDRITAAIDRIENELAPTATDTDEER